MSTTLSTLLPRTRHRLVVALLTAGLVLGFVSTVPPLVAQAASCPCSLFPSTTVPANPNENDTTAVELGMKFKADQSGSVTGVRFYKSSANTGTHTGSLWTAGGTRLGTKVTFTNETSSGWQQANFSAPITVTAGTTYVVSYYAPNGHYAEDDGGFSSAIVNSPLTGFADGGAAGANGVYRTGTGFPSSTYHSANYYVDVVFTPSGADTTKPTLTAMSPASGATGVDPAVKPTATFSEDVQASTVVMTLKQGTTTVSSTAAYNSTTRVETLTPAAALAASTTYTVTVSGAKDTAGNTMDAVSWSFTTSSGVDTTKPTLTAMSPASGATGVDPAVKPTATFSEDVQASTVVMTLKQGTTTVSSTAAYNSTTRVETLTPAAALAASTTYTVTVSGAKDAAGNTMDTVSWLFTTASAYGCPCSVWPTTTVPSTTSTADDSAVELGMRFRSNVAGYVTGLKFYKGSGNTGAHIGSLWSNTGDKMASVAFSNETATGWQTATFGAPQPIQANTTYVISYYAPVGRYANNGSYFASAATTNGPLTALKNGTDGSNGLYAYGGTQFPSGSYQSTNYWVDPIFNTMANDTVAPTLVSRAPAPGSTGAPLNGSVRATFSEPVVASSVAMELRDPSNALVAGAVSYDAASQTATFTPSQPLATSTTYTTKVSGAADSAGNVMAPDSWSFTTTAPAPPGPEKGPGGPIAVVTSDTNQYSKYLAEMLRTEGLNEFATIDVSTLSASTLASYDTVVLGSEAITAAQVSTLTTWVNNGGNLIAMRPGQNLSSLLGITSAGSTLSNAYLKVNTAVAPGAGIVSDSIQFHGTADAYTLSGATAVATLYSDAATATANPAVTMSTSGRGKVAAFTYDLPQSIALTRQGNPAWAGTERDNEAPQAIRSDDMFFVSKTDPAANWIDFNKVAIPQADEQQRLLANMIQLMNRDKKPLPRFWYFPKQGDASSGAPNLNKAVLVGTGDDHANNGTAGRFDQFAANSPAGCSVANWTCYRYTSYLWPNTPLSSTAASNYNSQGFEVALHVNTNGAAYTSSSIFDIYADQLAGFKSTYPTLPSPLSVRIHAIVWSDWASQPKAEVANGIKTDTNYYYYPASWIQDRPGFMTGSGMAMRFTDLDGTMIDNYQAATQMTDESGQTYPYNIDTLLDNAQGSTGYYGSFVANFHTDQSTEPQSDALLASAKSHNVPIVSARQLTNWLDGRNASSFGNTAWSGNTLSFSVSVGANATGLTGMLPTAGPNGSTLTGMSKGGVAVPYAVNTIKGLDYATFNAGAGSYTATYSGGVLSATSLGSTVGQVAPMTQNTLAVASASKEATTVPTTTTTQTARLAWQTSKPATSTVLVGTDRLVLRPGASSGVLTSKHTIELTGLRANTRYYYRVVSTDTAGKTTVAPALSAAPASLVTTATDAVAPVATDPVVFPLPDGTAKVTWTTTTPTAAGVRITDQGSVSGTDAAKAPVEKKIIKALTTDHSFLLTGLSPNRVYVLNAVSQDLAGNRTVSGAVKFVTPGLGVAQASKERFLIGKAAGDMTIGSDNTLSLSGDLTTARSGSYVSTPLDARQMVDWTEASISAQIPTDAKGAVAVRYGSTATPDSTWTDWAATKPGATLTGSSRYIQYRVTMSAGVGVSSPTLYAIGFTNNGPALPEIKETS